MPEILPVTLITTALNEAKSIPSFYQSLSEGSALPAEWVICDGGSTDDTVSILRNISRREIEIHIILEPGANIAQGRNKAIQMARFEVLAVTDFGCLVDQHWLHRITVPLLTDPSVDAVSGGYRIEGRTYFEHAVVASSIPISQLDPARFLPSSRSFAVRKNIIISVGGYPEHLSFAGEDTALCLALKRARARFVTMFNAQVVWLPRKTLSAFLLQHYLYGVGDGEMRQQHHAYLRITVKCLTGISILLLGMQYPLVRILFFVMPVAYYIYLRPKYEWSTVNRNISIIAFMLVALKELFLLCGFIKGNISGGKRLGS